MTGQTIQQIKSIPAVQESFWQFLAHLPASMEAQVLYALLIAGVIGMVAHYAMKWLSGEIEGSLLDYLFITYPRRTGLAFAAVLGAALAAVTSGIFLNDQNAFVGWMNVIWIGLTNGYACDSIANRGAAR